MQGRLFGPMGRVRALKPRGPGSSPGGDTWDVPVVDQGRLVATARRGRRLDRASPSYGPAHTTLSGCTGHPNLPTGGYGRCYRGVGSNPRWSGFESRQVHAGAGLVGTPCPPAPAPCGSSSSGRAPLFQSGCAGFETPEPLVRRGRGRRMPRAVVVGMYTLRWWRVRVAPWPARRVTAPDPRRSQLARFSSGGT